MIIDNVKIKTIKVPLNRTFITAIRSTDYLEDLLVEIHAGGYVGYGSAPATTAVTGDTIEGMQSVINNIISPNLMGWNALDRLGIYQKVFKKFAGNSGARMAIDIALFDLASKRANLPLYQYLGGNSNSLQTDVTISCGNIIDVKKNVEQALSKGFKILKIKLGNCVQDDVYVCKALAKIIPSNISLRIDANQGWTLKESLYFLQEISSLSLNIEIIEQPVAATDLSSMREITSKSLLPITADESVFTPYDAANILSSKSADILNIKLAKCGGIQNALKIKHMADGFHTECMVGCMMESPLGIAAAAHFASAVGITKVDLDPLDWVSSDVFSKWLGFDQGIITLSNNKPGIGYIP
jgi:L-alanine-DL-glutamate epimerase-like enolase superfamily enzyme